MVSKEVIIGGSAKADARPAAMLVQVASKFESSIYVEQQDRQINAKSIMGVMTLMFTAGEKVKISANGADETEALAGVEDFLTK